MAEDAPPETAAPPPAKGAGRRLFGWTRGLLLAALLFAMAAGGAFVVLDSPLGHRFVADRIAALTPKSGLRIRIGRIDGSLLGAMSLHEVVLSDAEGRFMVVPEARLDWRPLAWLGLDSGSGLDIRSLILKRGTLLRAPKLNPGDPNAPILPDYDIRIDRLVVEDLTIERSVFGQRRLIDLAAKADIRGGRALIDLKGQLGGRDRLRLHLDSEPDRDTFALGLVYNAPKDGLLAALTGVKRDIRADVSGSGRFSAWHGWGVATDNGQRLAGFLLDNRAGHYSLAGQIFPRDLLTGTARAAVGEKLSIVATGTATRSAVKGRVFAGGAAFRSKAEGALDLVNNRAVAVKLRALLTQPELVVAAPTLAGVTLDATVDGRFTALAIIHDLRVASLRSGAVAAEGLRTAGTAHWDGTRLRVPLAISATRVVTGEAQLDPRLPGARIDGDLVITGRQFASERLDVALKGVAARLALRGDLKDGGFTMAGPVSAKALALPNIGMADAEAKVLVRFGAGAPWSLEADTAGRLTRIDNGTLAAVTGGNVRVNAALSLGEHVPLVVRRAELTSAKLAMALHAWALPGGGTSLAGQGKHLDYGPFTFEAALASDGPRATLVLANPLPAASLRDVHVMLSPAGDGFRIETKGDSRLGPFSGLLALTAPKDAPLHLAVEHFTVYQTEVTGSLALAKEGVTGSLAIAGGGVTGTVDLAPQGQGQSLGQGLKAALTARGARFGGDKPIAVGNATITVDGLLEDGNSTLEASVKAEGISAGKLFIGRFNADAALVNGSGSVTASLAGRRGTNFALQGTGAFSPDKIVAFVAGDYAGRSITMPRRAVLDREGEGWRLQPTQIDFGRGTVIASGHMLGGPTEAQFMLSRMPLSVLDIVLPDLGMGGLASGVVEYRNDHLGAPAGHAAVEIKGLTRSGLVLTSRPLDLALVANLDATSLQTRAVVRESGQGAGMVRGRVQALVADLPRGGSMLERLRGGKLRAQVRYSGPAEALWRLVSVEVIDLTGPLGAAADVTGSIDHPVIAGAVATKALRVQSSLTGSDVREVEALGSFTDSRLSLAHFSGTTPGSGGGGSGGTISGSGTIDFSDLATHGVGLDLRIAATNAQLINRDDMAATITGPLRLISNGIGGTIAGRVHIDKARWTLGRASIAEQLPVIATTESNLRADIAPPRAPFRPWTYLIDAAGADRIDVRGLGLESEWGADVRLRGDTSNPQIFGSADLVRGGYEFAGKRFDLTRGKIRFLGEVPVDPRLDIVAEGDANGVSAKIAISGSALKPQIAFSSVPALPEEELLSRMLFGSSITQISAPEAVQLASALAALRGGGGLDPINKLRNAIGLDRLRILSADASVGRGTAIAVGKYIGRRIFVELTTDGRGYNATSAEFRVTRWLVLLGTISTIGDESINLKASKDY